MVLMGGGRSVSSSWSLMRLRALLTGSHTNSVLPDAVIASPLGLWAHSNEVDHECRE